MRRTLAAFVTACALLAGVVNASADWRKDMGVFRVGMIEANAPPQAGRAALKRAFEQALGMPVEILVLRDWPQLIDSHASSRINYAVYSSAAYATASELCQCVEPVAAPVDIDGATGVRSILLAREGKAGSVADVAAIKVAAGPVDDLTGWQAPAALLPALGLAMSADAALVLRAQGAKEAVELFRDGETDAIFGWERSNAGSDPLPGGTADQVPEVKTDVLWRSPLIRYGPHAVRKSLDREAKQALLEFLTKLHGANAQAYDLLSQGHGGGMVAATEGEYAPIREIVRKTATAE